MTKETLNCQVTNCLLYFNIGSNSNSYIPSNRNNFSMGSYGKELLNDERKILQENLERLKRLINIVI